MMNMNNNKLMNVTMDTEAMSIADLQMLIDRLTIDRRIYADDLHTALCQGNNEIKLYTMMCSTLTDNINFYQSILDDRLARERGDLLIGVDQYVNTGGNHYVLYIELALGNDTVLFAADYESYSIVECSYNDWQKALAHGNEDEIPVLCSGYDYIQLDDDCMLSEMNLNLKIGNYDYPQATYNKIEQRIESTILRYYV